jgi:hypothetical protein
MLSCCTIFIVFLVATLPVVTEAGFLSKVSRGVIKFSREIKEVRTVVDSLAGADFAFEVEKLSNAIEANDGETDTSSLLIAADSITGLARAAHNLKNGASIDNATQELLGKFEQSLHGLGSDLKSADVVTSNDLEARVDYYVSKWGNMLDEKMEAVHSLHQQFGPANSDPVKIHETMTLMLYCVLFLVPLFFWFKNHGDGPVLFGIAVVVFVAVHQTGIVAIWFPSTAGFSNAYLSSTTESAHSFPAQPPPNSSCCNGLEQTNSLVRDLFVLTSRLERERKELLARLTQLETFQSQVLTQVKSSNEERRIQFADDMPFEATTFTLKEGSYLVQIRGQKYSQVDVFGQLVLERLVTTSVSANWEIMNPPVSGRPMNEGMHDPYYGSTWVSGPFGTITDLTLVTCKKETTFRMKLIKRDIDTAEWNSFKSREVRVFPLFSLNESV